VVGGDRNPMKWHQITLLRGKEVRVKVKIGGNGCVNRTKLGGNW